MSQCFKSAAFAGHAAKQGFTLIELMIVVVIIGVLTGLAIPRFGGVASSAKQHEAHLVLKQIYTLQGAYVNETGLYATSINLLRPTYETPQVLKYFQEPQITGGGNPANGYTVCMVSLSADVPNRSINHQGLIAGC